jgi:uncharacterized membrane protein
MIFLILAASFILRLISINQSLWLDEAIGAEAVRDFSLTGLISEFPKFDNHPPLYYLVLKLWTDMFGYSELSLRVPSVVFGAGTAYLTYLIARHILPKQKIFYFLAPLFLATSGLHVYYSQEARMYSMAAFLAALSVYMFLRKKWVFFSVSLTALIFTDYMPAFLLPVFWIWGILQKKKDFWKGFILAHIPLIVLGIFWLPIFAVQGAHGKWLLEALPGWQSIAGGASFKQAALVWTKFVFGRISLNDKFLYAVLLGSSSIPFIFSLFKAAASKDRPNFLWLWFLGPLLFGFLASALFPAFIYFRFLYVLPAFYLLAAWGIAKLRNSQIQRLLILALVVVNLVQLCIYWLDSSQKREDWRGATASVEGATTREEIVLFEYPEPFTPFRWYSKGKVGAYGATDEIYADSSKTKARTGELIKDKKGIYYFDYLRDISDPKGYVLTTIKEQGFTAKKVYNFNGVGQVTHFTIE